MIAKLEWTQSNLQQNIEQTDSDNESSNNQRINNSRTTALERTAAETRGGGLNFLRVIFALKSTVVEVHAMLSSH